MDADVGFFNSEEENLKTTMFPLELLLTVDAPPNVNVMDFSLLDREQLWLPLIVIPFEVVVVKEHDPSLLPTVNVES